MIIKSKAPLRLGLAGGGTDVSPYCDMYGGYVLNATIDLWAYSTIETLNLPVIRVNSADAGVSAEIPLGTGPVASGAILVDGVVNRCIRDFGPLPGGFYISTCNDAPIGSGLGTSSTMVVCILKSFLEWYGVQMSPYRLAQLAFEIERRDLGLEGGRQDQYAAAFGGFNFMEFLPGDRVVVRPLELPREKVEALEDTLLLYFTGRSREGGAIIARQQQAAAAGEKEKVEAMHRIRRSAFDMRDAVAAGDLDRFASIIGEAWEDKKKMASGISNSVIQAAFDTALEAGALTGKVSGAGGGGFIMFIVPPSRREAVTKALSRLTGKVQPFSFTFEGASSWKL